MTQHYSRRQVIQRGAGAAAFTLLPLAGCAQPEKDERSQQPAQSTKGTKGANERVRIAIAGLHGRGGSHVGAFSGMKDVEVAYLVDPDTRTWEGRKNEVIKNSDGRSNPKTVQDIRQVLDDKNVDAISIATPNHWHSLMTLWACQAGKDVYVEKPMSHNVHEGRIVVEAAKKYDRIVQHGTQRRSSEGWMKVMAAIQSGKLGKLKVARGLCYKNRPSIGHKPFMDPPSELDFGLWQGPARGLKYHENLVHYNWHWFWDTGNGDIGNQGVHQMDVAMWGLNSAPNVGTRMPKSAISLGGRFAYQDQGETANTQVAVMDYGDAQLIFEVRHHTNHPYKGQRVGNIFHMEAGTIIEHKFYPEGSKESAPLPDVKWNPGPGSGNFGNFIEAVRSHKTSDQNAPVGDAHYCSALCHFANMSYRLGEMKSFDQGAEAIGNNLYGQEAYERMQLHMWKDGLDLKQIQVRVGPKLMVDAKNERFIGNDKANAMLFRDYREGFKVPESIS